MIVVVEPPATADHRRISALRSSGAAACRLDPLVVAGTRTRLVRELQPQPCARVVVDLTSDLFEKRIVAVPTAGSRLVVLACFAHEATMVLSVARRRGRIDASRPDSSHPEALVSPPGKLDGMKVVRSARQRVCVDRSRRSRAGESRSGEGSCGRATRDRLAGGQHRVEAGARYRKPFEGDPEPVLAVMRRCS